MIFLLRLIIFSALIILGFGLAIRSLVLRKIVNIVYAFALSWYTLFCRINFSGPMSADSANVAFPPAEPNVGQRLLSLIMEIFGSQSDGTLAGDGVGKAVIFNAMLFVPMGFLLLLLFSQLRESRRGRVHAILMSVIVSMMIEFMQEITSLGMADWKDVAGTTHSAQ